MKCELCHEDEFDNFNYIYKDDDDKYILRLSAGWNEWWDDWEHGEIEIKYCPKCGRKLDS